MNTFNHFMRNVKSSEYGGTAHQSGSMGKQGGSWNVTECLSLTQHIYIECNFICTKKHLLL